jgi:hypothetical protein
LRPVSGQLTNHALALGVSNNRRPQEVFDTMTDPENDQVWQRPMVAIEAAEEAVSSFPN